MDLSCYRYQCTSALENLRHISQFTPPQGSKVNDALFAIYSFIETLG